METTDTTQIKENKEEIVNEEIIASLGNWREVLKKYQKKNPRKAAWQIITSFGPFIGLWVLMYFSLQWSTWITIGLAIINAFFMVRIFIIQHDCGHQSFLDSRKLNNAIGFVCSFFSSLPYKYWAKVHNFHHGHSGQLEVRDVGDIPFLTVNEFKSKSKWGQFFYRIFRSPVVLFFFAPIFYLFFSNRYPFYFNFKSWKGVKRAQIRNNILITLVYALLAFLIGWKQFLIIQFSLIAIFGIIAFWFFYVQHQHEFAYKQWKENWDFVISAIRGSTYYKLPKLFQWLTGNIGFHHIHHLNSLIPNYNLEKCFRENKFLNKYVTTLTFRESLKLMKHKLWDEEREKMITFLEYYRNERRLATKLS